MDTIYFLLLKNTHYVPYSCIIHAPQYQRIINKTCLLITTVDSR